MLNNIAAIGQKYTRNIVRVLHIIEDTILVTLLLAMILLAGYDILARTLFGGGVAWISPILKIMVLWVGLLGALLATRTDRKSTRLNSSHVRISYAVFCLKKKINTTSD